MKDRHIEVENPHGASIHLSEAWLEQTFVFNEGRMEAIGAIPYLAAPDEIIECMQLHGRAMARAELWSIRGTSLAVFMVRGEQSLTALVIDPASEMFRPWLESVIGRGYLPLALVGTSAVKVIRVYCEPQFAKHVAGLSRTTPRDPERTAELAIEIVNGLSDPARTQELGFAADQLKSIHFSVCTHVKVPVFKNDTERQFH